MRLSLRKRVGKVYNILRTIARRHFGGFRKVLRIGRQSLKKTATEHYQLLLGIIHDEGIKKIKELADFTSKPGSWKEGEWKSFAKGYFEDYFGKVGEAWNGDQRIPERYLNKLLADLYTEFKP